MRSEAQIRASRLNGAKSRGPRRKTTAPQLGLSGRNVVLCNESHELFEQLERNCINDLKLVNIIEHFLIQRMAAALKWKLAGTVPWTAPSPPSTAYANFCRWRTQANASRKPANASSASACSRATQIRN